MKIAVVPNCVRDAINEKLDAAYAAVPEAASEREDHYGWLLAYYDEHGVLPEFKLVRMPAAASSPVPR